jgi:hypothetical protein
MKQTITVIRILKIDSPIDSPKRRQYYRRQYYHYCCVKMTNFNEYLSEHVSTKSSETSQLWREDGLNHRENAPALSQRIFLNLYEDYYLNNKFYFSRLNHKMTLKNNLIIQYFLILNKHEEHNINI